MSNLVFVIPRLTLKRYAPNSARMPWNLCALIIAGCSAGLWLTLTRALFALLP